MSKSEFVRDKHPLTFGFHGDPSPVVMYLAEYRCQACGAIFTAMKSRSWENLPCNACQAQATEIARLTVERKQAELATVGSIPVRLRWAEFQSEWLYQRVTPAKKVDVARSCVRASSIVIVGPHGVGKSSLAAAILREQAKESATLGAWVTAFDLSTARAQTRLGSGEADTIATAKEAKHLVIDELGAERASDTAIDEVIRARHDEMLPTIFTTGFSQPELIQKYGGGVARRIFDSAKRICLGGTK